MSVYEEVAAEVERARTKFDKSLSAMAAEGEHYECLAVLGEEYGEVCRELNEALFAGRPVDAELMRAELIQVAACAAAWAIELAQQEAAS